MIPESRIPPSSATGTLYIDGHARAYHGHQTKLPRHYTARKRLCLRATTDYWVNGLDRLPFFKLNQAVDPGLTIAELPEEERFLKLATRSKHFIETIKIIAYRAETALAHIVREHLNAHHQDEARTLIRDICTASADIHPDARAKTLTITLHSLATPRHNSAVTHLCAELNASRTRYPGTDLLMIFKSVSN